MGGTLSIMGNSEVPYIEGEEGEENVHTLFLLNKSVFSVFEQKLIMEYYRSVHKTVLSSITHDVQDCEDFREKANRRLDEILKVEGTFCAKTTILLPLNPKKNGFSKDDVLSEKKLNENKTFGKFIDKKNLIDESNIILTNLKIKAIKVQNLLKAVERFPTDTFCKKQETFHRDLISRLKTKSLEIAEKYSIRSKSFIKDLALLLARYLVHGRFSFEDKIFFEKEIYFLSPHKNEDLLHFFLSLNIPCLKGIPQPTVLRITTLDGVATHPIPGIIYSRGPNDEHLQMLTPDQVIPLLGIKMIHRSDLEKIRGELKKKPLGVLVINKYRVHVSDHEWEDLLEVLLNIGVGCRAESLNIDFKKLKVLPRENNVLTAIRNFGRKNIIGIHTLTYTSVKVSDF